MASVSQLRSGKWRVRWRDANGHQDSATFTTKGEATRHGTTMEASVIGGSYVDQRRAKERLSTFGIEWAASQDWKAMTRQGFPRAFGRAVEILDDPRLGQVDQLMIQRARVEMYERYSDNTVDLTMSYLLAVMRAAYTTGRIGRDPTVGARRRRRKDDSSRVGPDQVPTRDEVTAIWQGAPSRFRAAIALGATGLRVGEVLGMTADRLDLDARLVTVDRQMQRIGGEMVFTTPKNEKKRTIRVPGAVAVELRRHLREHQGGGLLFRGARVDRLRRDQFYASAWRPALIGAGLDRKRFVFHSLRHFAASSMLAEGVNPMAVAGHLGDTLETLQRVYAHWLRDDRDVPADALDRILAAPADSEKSLGL